MLWSGTNKTGFRGTRYSGDRDSGGRGDQSDALGASMDNTVRDLNTVYAYERSARRAYAAMAAVSSRKVVPPAVPAAFRRMAAEKLKSEVQVARRILSLGGQPESRVTGLDGAFRSCFPHTPSDFVDWGAVSCTVLEAERTAADVTGRLAPKYAEQDRETHDLLISVLARESRLKMSWEIHSPVREFAWR